MKLFISVIITLFLLTVCVDIASAQTLVNGANQTGTVLLNTTNSYTFSANKGDNINLRVGTTGFNGYLQLYGSGSVLLTSAGGYTDDLIENYVATNSGTFTVTISSWNLNGTGTYVLNLAQTPEAFIVPGGDQGGSLTNGADATGTITLGDQDMWSFTANKGDTINARVGTTGFNGFIELFGPTGALLTSEGGYADDLIENYVATNSGTFTVLVSGWGVGGTGTYVLNLAQTPEPFIVPSGDEGGPLTNGTDATGTITLGDQDMWSFTANKGDTINARVGTTGFNGFIELFGPTGALLASEGGYADDLIEDYVATNSGTFTVLVSGWGVGGTGTYVLNLAQMPEAFIVPGGDQGGSLTNGADATGTITLGDQDMWSFTANKGDTINARVGTTGFNGFIELFGPTGALLASEGGYADDLIEDYVATNSGTFTVLVSGWGVGGTGTYVLNLAQMPEPFIVPSGDEGGSMAGSANYSGTINRGDQDIWAFTACTGDSISLGLNTTNFNGFLELYGSNGTLLKSSGGSTVSSIVYTATNCGTFTVLVSGWGVGGTGTYGLTANGLIDDLRLCLPVISGANLTLNGVGGTNGVGFKLYSTTNIATPWALWIPVLTNQFDQFGVLKYTNVYNSTIPYEYFRFVLP